MIKKIPENPFDGLEKSTLLGHIVDGFENKTETFVPAKSVEPETCEWKIDEDGIYSTSCKNKFFFTEGDGLADHRFKFCPYCGLKIKEVK